MSKAKTTLLAICVLSLVIACAPKEEAAAPEPVAQPQEMPAPEKVAPLMASTTLQVPPDSSVGGTVTFTETAEGVRIAAHITGASPGLHGIHLHEFGDCSAEDFTSTGGHFNPTDAPHGAPTDAERHAGDFGNIEVGDDGVGHLELTSDMLTVAAGPNSVVGRAVILHAGEDDLVSQPTGAAGGRLACGTVSLEGAGG
jgi:Cu-Zn family superoxide dismutase